MPLPRPHGIGDAGGESMRYSNEATFTGAIYIYYEGNLTDNERVELRSIYAQHKARIFFRDHRYLSQLFNALDFLQRDTNANRPPSQTLITVSYTHLTLPTIYSV